MELLPGRFSRDVLVNLSDSERAYRISELEIELNARLRRHAEFAAFQAELYRLIEQLKSIGHVLYSWDYDSEVEYWGGDYTNKGVEYELLLRSEFPVGVKLAWKDPEALP